LSIFFSIGVNNACATDELWNGDKDGCNHDLHKQPNGPIGISGASGAIYGIRFLEILSNSAVETHLIITEAAEDSILRETDWEIKKVKSLATVTYNTKNLAADISSGSYPSEGMVIILWNC